MHLINVTADNLELDSIPCIDFKNPANGTYFTYNRDWLVERLREGMIMKSMDTPFAAFIQYSPAEIAWRAVLAPGFTFIHHLFVEEDQSNHRLKSELLQCCESESSEKNGVAVMLNVEDFRELQPFYLQHGYRETAHLPGFVLMVKKFIYSAPDPVFALSVFDHKYPHQSHHIAITYANQSSFINYYIHQMKKEFQELGFHVTLQKLNNVQEARESGSPYGTFGVFLDGQFLTHRLLNRNEIETLIGSLDLYELYPEREYLFDEPRELSLN